MKYPNFIQEKKLWKKGFKRIACLDEAGRGSLAGPMVAAAIMIKPIRDIRSKFVGVHAIKDSKKLSPQKREEVYKTLLKNKNIEWGIGRVSEKVIDKINIFEATKLAMERGAKNLEKKLAKNQKKSNRRLINFLILDGNFKINVTRKGKSIRSASSRLILS